MKKIICILLLTVFLCGCGVKARSTVCADSFGSEVHILYSGEEYICDMEKSGISAKFSFIAPENLAGFSLVFEDGEVYSYFKTLEFKPELSSFVAGNPLLMLCNVLYDAADKECAFVGGEYVLRGTVNDGEYKLTVSPSGLPANCEINGITAVFYNQTLT